METYAEIRKKYLSGDAGRNQPSENRVVQTGSYEKQGTTLIGSDGGVMPNLNQKSAQWLKTASFGLKAYESDRARKLAFGSSKEGKQQQRIERMAADPLMDANPFYFNMVKQYAEDTSYKEIGDNWTEDQKQEFGYLYASDKKQAEEYAIRLNNALKAATKNEQRKGVAQKATDSPLSGAWETAKAIGANTLGIGEYVTDMAEYAARGRITEKTDRLNPVEYAQTVTGSIADKLNGVDAFGVAHKVIDERVPVFGGKGWGDVYQLGTSIAQSMASGHLLGGTGTLISYFGSAAASGIDDAKSRGATDEQAVAIGTLQGIAEGLAEKIGVDNLLKLGAVDSIRGFMRNVAVQAGREGIEEGLTSLFNNISDDIVMGENSLFYDRVNRYVESGMEESNARKRAWLESAEEIIFDAVAGAASGGIAGGLETGARTALYGLDFSGEDVSIQDTAIISDALKKFGETENVEAVAAAAVKAAAGQELTISERKLLKNSLLGEWMVNTLRSDPLRSDPSGKMENMSRTHAETWMQAAESFVGKSQDKPAEANGEAVPVSDNATLESNNSTELANNATPAFNNTTPVLEKSTLSGANEKSSAVDDKMSATESAVAEESSDAAEDTVSLEEASKKYGDQAGAMIHTYTAGQDVAKYDRAYQAAYDMGKSGVSLNYVRKSDSTYYLTDSQKELAYEAGMAAAGSAATAQVAKNKAAINGKTGWRKGTVKGQGVKIADMTKAFNDPQRKAYQYLSNIAEVTGVDIVLYKSETDADGNYQGAQGKFKWNENTIYIDINAGLDHYANADQLAKYTMMRTFDHEFTHFIEKWNPEEYNSFRSLVFETMESNGTNVEDAIELMMEKTGNALTYDQASRELIAEAMTDILPETSFIEQLARKNQNVFQQLLSKLKEFLTSIKQHFASMSNSNQEAKALKKQMGETVSYIEEIVKKFDEVAVKAVENYQWTVAEDATVSKEEKVVSKKEKTTETKPAETVTEDTVSETEDTVIESSKVVSEDGKVASEDASLDASPASATEEYRSEHGYTIRPNEQYGSLEITFDSKPSQEVRNALKANKFRWNGKKGVWYGKTDRQAIVDALDKAYQPKAADPVDLSQKPMERTGDTVTIGDPAKATHEVEVTLSDEEYEALMQAVPEKQEATEPAPATEAAQEVPPKAETEEAKQELRKAVRMPIQGTNAEALLQGIKSKELSMESITLSGSVEGFNDQQRHHLVSRLLEGVYTDSAVIKIDVPYDGKFEIVNTPGNVAKVLENLKVRANQEAMFDKKTISLLTSNGDVRIVELDGQKYLSNSYVMIPATDTGIEYIKAEFNGKEMTLHPPVAEAFQRADKPLKEAPTEAKLGKTNVLIFREDGKQLFFDKRYFAPLDGGQLFYAEINGAGILKSVDASGNVLGYLMGIKPGKDSKITNEKPSNLKSYQQKKGTGKNAAKSTEKTDPVAEEAAAPVPEEKPDTQKTTAAKAAKPATVETSVKLEDFGEKIGGARKDQWSKRGLLADDLTDMNDRERDKNVKKDNVWKRPDYRKLIEGGADRNILFVRNEIRKALNQNIDYPYRTTEEQRLRIQKEFIETVREIQAMAEKVSSKEDLLAMGRTWLKANGYIQESGTSYTEKWRKNPALMGTDYVYTIEHLARNFDNLTKLADKANFAVDAEKKIPNGFSIHEDDSNHTWFITRGSWIVKHSFPSYDDALNYLRNAASNSKKKTRFVPQQLLEVHRKGPDYRSSKDVKGQDYLDIFGFKGGEFGNWMSEKDRRVSMNYGFDALKDLADALGIADTDISLGGNLSIAFGARGQGLSGAAAHYEQERHVINLTKMNGAGSLAHEWFHALDDFLGGYGSKFATEYGAKLPEATKAAVRHLLTTMQYRDATQEETDMAATKAYEQAKRSVTYQVSNQFGWVQKVENGTFQDHDARYYTRKPTAADAERYHALLDKLLETGDAAIVDELSALRKEVTGHVIPKEDRDSIGYRLSALRPDATRNVQKMRLRSDFYNGSRRFGELHHKDGDYWDSTIEMAARAFACYVADKTGKHNDYLSAHSDTAATLDVDKNGNVSVVRAYPTGQERVQINAAFDQLFAALKEDGFLHQQGEVSKPDIIQYQRRPGEVRRFSYEWFTSKPDMPITEVEHIGKVNTKQQRNQIIEKAMENAKSVGTVNELGNPVVHVKDTGTDVMISKTGIRHSMDRRAGVVGSVAVKIGDILSNAILMNELNPRSENITDSYILIGAAKNKTNEPYIVSFVVNRYTSEVTDIDVLYAVNAKTEPAGSLSPSITAETAGYFTGSTVTISNLLDFVNQYFPDTMPEDVLKHYGHDRRPDGTLGQDALYQQRYGTLTDRDILDLAANDLRIDEMTEKERNALNVFRDRLAKLQKLQQERFELGKQYRQQQFMPEGNRKAAASTLAQMRDLDSRIETISDKILDMEERSVLKEVLKKARKIVEEKQKDHDDEIIRNRRNRRNEAANARKYRQQITKNAKTLMDWITNPSNKDVMKHVPDVLKDSVIPLLNQIDFTSKQQLNGKEATKADLEFAKRLKKVKSVLDKDISAAELNSGYYDFSPQFREKLDSVVAEVRVLAENSSGEFVLNRMSAKDLKDLAEVIHELKQLIQNYNRLHNNALFENAYEAGGSTIHEMSQYQNAPDRGKAGEAAHRFLLWKQIRPIHGWERLGKGGLSVFHEFWSGHSRYAFNIKKVIDFTGNASFQEKVNEKGLAWAESADKLTWAAIWCSCKEEVLLRGMKYGDPGFFDAVTKLFDEVIYRTQVVDSILTKNEYMRDSSFIPRFTSSFMSEPVTTASMVMSSMDKYQMDLQKGLSIQEAWKRNKRAIGVTVGIYSAGSILNAALQAVMDAFRDDDEYETYGEKYWEAFKGNLVDELMPLNKIPIISDAYEIVKELVGVVTDYFWDYEIYGNAPETITGQLTDKGVKVVEILCQKLSGEDTSYTYYAVIYNLLQIASGLTGLPMANFVREVTTFWNNTVGAMAPSLKVKTYEPKEESQIKYAYQDGYLTEEEAAEELLARCFDMDAEDITAQINRWSAKVETGIAFDDIKDAFIDGEITEKQAIDMYMRYGGYTQKDARKTVTEWKAQKENGVSMSDLEEQFIRGSVSERDAISRLQKYSGVAKTEAEARIQEWKCEKETGIPYDELSDRYVAGKITSTRARELRVEYGGSSLEDARKTVLKWDCEKDHGIKYGELSTAYLSGDISKTNAINWQMEYGEKSRDDAELAVQAWVWRADNPKYKDLSDQKIDRFITHCVPAGIDVTLYYKAQDHVKKIVSDGTSGNVKNQYVDYILSLGLSPYKAKAMWKALKNSTWKDTGTPFA